MQCRNSTSEREIADSRTCKRGYAESEVTDSKLEMGREDNTEPWRSAVDVAVLGTVST
jgi:hypothetical protein